MKELQGLLPFVLIALVFWLLLVRPQRRRQRELAATRAALEVGSEVMLGSGIFGRVRSLEDETVHVELAPGVSVKVARQAIARVVDTEVDTEVDRVVDTGADPDVAPVERHEESSDANELGGPSDPQR